MRKPQGQDWLSHLIGGKSRKRSLPWRQRGLWEKQET